MSGCISVFSMRKSSRLSMLCSMANSGCVLLSGAGMLPHSLQCPPAFLYLPEVRTLDIIPLFTLSLHLSLYSLLFSSYSSLFLYLFFYCPIIFLFSSLLPSVSFLSFLLTSLLCVRAAWQCVFLLSPPLNPLPTLMLNVGHPSRSLRLCSPLSFR